MTAVGTPGGGTYQWTISGGTAQLVDSAGSPTTTGATVYLRAFKADDGNGRIPAQTAQVQVKYTHPNGTATDSKTVPVHKIEFTVTDTTVTKGVVQANETAADVTLGFAPGVATMSTDPKVKIKLDASCPRKVDCASNHRVGWLQAVLTHVRAIRFRHTLLTISMPLPIRDNIAGPFPFYQWVTAFTGDGNTQTAHHEDSPTTGTAWTDYRVAAPAPPPAVNRQLRKIEFKEGFRAWLVVQNVEWSLHDMPGSFAYQKNFQWSLSHTVTTDTTKPVGSRCRPFSSNPKIGSISNGKGSNPVLSAPTANGSMTQTLTPAPAI